MRLVMAITLPTSHERVNSEAFPSIRTSGTVGSRRVRQNLQWQEQIEVLWKLPWYLSRRTPLVYIIVVYVRECYISSPYLNHRFSMPSKTRVRTPRTRRPIWHCPTPDSSFNLSTSQIMDNCLEYQFRFDPFAFCLNLKHLGGTNVYPL